MCLLAAASKSLSVNLSDLFFVSVHRSYNTVLSVTAFFSLFLYLTKMFLHPQLHITELCILFITHSGNYLYLICTYCESVASTYDGTSYLWVLLVDEYSYSQAIPKVLTSSAKLPTKCNPKPMIGGLAQAQEDDFTKGSCQAWQLCRVSYKGVQTCLCSYVEKDLFYKERVLEATKDKRARGVKQLLPYKLCQWPTLTPTHSFILFTQQSQP